MASYRKTLDYMMAAHPRLFPTEAHAAHHLFFVTGNGYDWEQGALVPMQGFEDPAQVRQRHAQWRHDQGMPPVVEQAFALPPIKQLYPLWAQSDIVTIPDDVQPDWLEAAAQAVTWAKTVETTAEDRMYLRRATQRIASLKHRTAPQQLILWRPPQPGSL